jgi:hypothetical protein
MRSIHTAIRVAVLSCLFVLCTPAAHAVGNLADVTVYDRTAGRMLPAYHHQGRYYVVGRAGHEFQVKLRNCDGGDVLAVLSVDGVNAISGETAAWDQTGYVLTTGGTASIGGWRKNTNSVASFYFTRLPDAYATRIGRPDNVGVIGVAVFRRKPLPPVVPFSYQLPEAAAPTDGNAPARAAGETAQSDRAIAADAWHSRKAESLGTGHGRREYSPVRYTDFERATETPAEVIAIHYDSYRNLVAMGVIPVEPVVTNPFPGAPGFVPDPPR